MKKQMPIFDVEELASASECTGLIPAAVQTPEEGQNYAELYAIHEQKTAWEHGAEKGVPCNEKRKS